MVVAVVVGVRLGVVCVCVCTWGMGSMLPCTLKILPKSPKPPEVISHVLPYQSLLLLPQIDKNNNTAPLNILAYSLNVIDFFKSEQYSSD